MACEQLTTPLGDRLDVDAGPPSDLRVSPVAESDRLESQVEATLLFVENREQETEAFPPLRPFFPEVRGFARLGRWDRLRAPLPLLLAAGR